MKTIFMAIAIWCVAAMPVHAFNILDPFASFNSPEPVVTSQTPCLTKTQARRMHPTEHLWYNVQSTEQCWHAGRTQHVASKTTKHSHSQRSSSIIKCYVNSTELVKPAPQKIKYIPETYDWMVTVRDTFKNHGYYRGPPGFY